MSKTTRASLLNGVFTTPLPGLPGGPAYAPSGPSGGVIRGVKIENCRRAGLDVKSGTVDADGLEVESTPTAIEAGGETPFAGVRVGRIIATNCGMAVRLIGSARAEIGSVDAIQTPFALWVDEDAHLKLGTLRHEPGAEGND